MQVKQEIQLPEAGIDATPPHRSPQLPFMKIATVVVALTLTGAVAGAIAAVFVLTIGEVLAQVGDPSATGFTALVSRILSVVLQVLAVASRSPLDGALMGLGAGVAVAFVYTVTAILGNRRQVHPAEVVGRRWLFLVLLAAAGAIGAAVASHGLLADSRLLTGLAGAFFGLVAGFAISQPD